MRKRWDRRQGTSRFSVTSALSASPVSHVSLPLFTEDEAILQVPGAMSDADWTQMMAVLDAMKPGILKRTAEGADD